MARSTSSCAVLGSLLVGVLFAAGCQQHAATVVDAGTLPSPNFDGPTFHDRPARFPAAAANPRPTLPAPTRVAATPPAPAYVPPPRNGVYGGDAGVPRDWRPWAAARNWHWIVIHHSATPTGGAAAFDRMHRNKGWDELGYHFVIGNGTDTRDGLVETGSRWSRQKHGAHAKTANNEFNDFGIGVCLVGNFDADRPSAAQMASLAKLVAHLSRAYRVPPERIIGHGTVKSTDCPGRYLSVAEVRRRSALLLAAETGGSSEHLAAYTPAELLVESAAGAPSR